MILLWLSFCFVHISMAQNSTTTPPSKQAFDFKTKPVICAYTTSGPNGKGDSIVPEIALKSIPCECDIILYDGAKVDLKTGVICDIELLKKMTAVKPVILSVYRANQYLEWVNVLKDDKASIQETNALIDFAKKNNVIGYLLFKLTPEEFMDTFDPIVAVKIIEYIKLLKTNTNLSVGVSINPFGFNIKNPCHTKFSELNGVVDYYSMRTYSMNVCISKLYNGESPIKLRKHGPDYMTSLEEIMVLLRATKCDLEKVYLVAELFFSDNSGSKIKYFSFNYKCSCEITDTMCIPDTHELYEKGKYIKEVRCGLHISFINFDNTVDDCHGCGTFVGFRNIFAGYNTKEIIPCEKFDVKKSQKGS